MTGRPPAAAVTPAAVAPRAGLAMLIGLVGLIGSVGLGGTARGHNPDTSYARVAIGPDAVVIRLTYDVTSLVRMAPGLDADGDARLTPAGLAAGVPAIAAFLRDRVACEIDAAAVRLTEPEPVAWPPDAGPAIAAADWHAPTSLVAFAFRLPTPRRPADVWLRFGFYDDLGLAHAVLGAFEQAGSTEECVFTAFEPDYLFETSWADAVSRSPPRAATPSPTDPAPAISAGPSASAPPPAAGRRGSTGALLKRLVVFFRLGVEHILVGFDHVLFLVALVLASDLRGLVRIVTAFTVAHFRHARGIRAAAALAIAACGVGWFLDRALGTSLMPW